MHSDEQGLERSLREAAEALRKEAAAIRSVKPIVKHAGYTVSIDALRELIRNGSRQHS